MKTPLTCLLTAASLSSILLAQAPYTVTPRGVDLVELSSSTSIALNWPNSTTRVQQADNAHTGTPRLLTSIAWRRNGTAARANTITTTLDLYIAHSDFSSYSNTFASNYKGTPTMVFTGAKVLDWTAPSSLPVGEWADATFPFATPFLYNGIDALLWETQTTTFFATSSNYSLDWSSSPPYTRSSLIPQILGSGCTTANGQMTLATTFTVDTANFVSSWSVTGAAGNTPTSVYLGVSNPDFPLLCGRLHTDALVSFPLGPTNATGSASQTITQPWLPSLAGACLSAQALSIPFLSNGLQLCLPKAIGGSPFLVKRIYNTQSSTAPLATGAVTASCQPTQFK